MGRGRGQPSKLTPDMEARLCQHIEMGLTFTDACLMEGISKETFSNWRRKGREASTGKYHDFFQSTMEAEARFKDKHLQRIDLASQHRDNWQASKWLLGVKYPDEFGQTVRHEAGEQVINLLRELRGIDDGEDNEEGAADAPAT